MQVFPQTLSLVCSGMGLASETTDHSYGNCTGITVIATEEVRYSVTFVNVARFSYSAW